LRQKVAHDSLVALTPADRAHALTNQTSPLDTYGRQPFRVLVVDDNHDAADMLARLLRTRGNNVQTAYSGADALQAAEHFLPDCIITDIAMPGLDGYEVARRIRADQRFKKTPLIALTAYSDTEKTSAAGFDHHLVKPVTSTALAALIVELAEMSQRLKDTQETSQEQANALAEVKELIHEVEDEVRELKTELKEEVQELKQELQEVKDEVKELKQAEEQQE
jgi:CheY-like chemotaxis protein